MKVAVVGAGSAGLGAVWALNRSEHEVHLFEADSRPGGHANTVENGTKELPYKVDTGFIVFNTRTYPNFLAFLIEENIPYLSSDMSFAVSRDRGLYEWAGASPAAVFAQRINLLNPAQWRMVWDILRFNTGALEVLREGKKESIGSYLARRGYSNSFVDNYLLPMTAAIWSTPPDTAALDFPAATLIQFMWSHCLLQIIDRPTWLTIENGSHEYVRKIINQLPQGHYRESTGIRSASSVQGGKIKLETVDGKTEEFDHVVFACHADTTLEILKKGKGITQDEKEVLSGFEFSTNRAVLHGDYALMPTRRSTWSAWNYLTASDGPKANVNSVSLTYWMNLLQSIDKDRHGLVAVTLNPPFEPKKELVGGEWTYEHPLFSAKSVASQAELPRIQNKRGITFAGAWTKYGFHEDGFASGLRVASDYLSASPPFPIRSADRPLTNTTSDKLLQIVLSSLEALRRILEVPWVWFMVLAALWLELVEGAVGVAGGLVKKAGAEESAKKAERLRGDLRRVRGFWEASAGKEVKQKRG